MSDRIIYLDNAATSFPKPESVIKSVESALRNLGSSGRGAHKMAFDAGRAVFETRNALAEFLGASAERLMFTPGCTFSINAVLKGMDLKDGETVLISALEHNAVVRPLRQLEHSRNVNVVTLPYTPGEIVAADHLDDFLSASKPRLCILTEGSNVSGEILDLAAAARICLKHRVPLLVDAAQTAGRNRDILQLPGISFWAASGHKGFFAPAGVGLLYVNPNYNLEPLVSGGTGSGSESAETPEHYPDRLESGTLPLPNIAGLLAGVQFLNEVGVDNVRAHELSLLQRFISWAQKNESINLLGAGREENETGLPLISFEVAGTTPDRVADILDTEYGIAVRSGLHCAAHAHSTLGTLKLGTVRASFGYFNTNDDVDALCIALSAVARR